MPKATKQSLAKKYSFFASYGAALLWAAFILLLCGLPGDEFPKIDFWDIDIEDKIAHAGVFFVLGYLMVCGFFRRKAKPTPKNIILLFMVIAAVYGALTEIFQEFFFPTRFGDFFDFVADSLGGILGILFGKYVIAKRATCFFKS